MLGLFSLIADLLWPDRGYYIFSEPAATEERIFGPYVKEDAATTAASALGGQIGKTTIVYLLKKPLRAEAPL